VLVVSSLGGAAGAGATHLSASGLAPKTIKLARKPAIQINVGPPLRNPQSVSAASSGQR